jgi:hypothetical protein
MPSRSHRASGHTRDRKKGAGKKQGAPRIDESLVERFEARRRIEELLQDDSDEEDVGRRAGALAKDALAISPQAPAILLELALGAEPEAANLALLLLGETDPQLVEPSLQALLAREDLSHEDQLRLLTVKTLLYEDPESVIEELGRHGDPLDLLAEMTGQFWDRLSPAETAILWIEQYAELDDEDKCAVLALFMQIARRDSLVIARIEALSGQPQVDRLLAERLADFAYPEAVEILQELARSTDTGVRLAAETSLRALRSSHPDLGPPPPTPALLGGGEPYEAYVAQDPLAGQFSVICSRRDPDGRIAFCVALIDAYDQGLLDIWGNAGFSKSDFEKTVEDFNDPEEEDAAFFYEPADPDFVLFLLREAEELSRRRHYDLPAAHRLWRELYTPELPVKGSYDVVFGRECSECDEPIRPHRLTDDGGPIDWVFSDFAVCADCLAVKTQCALCGAPIVLEEATALYNVQEQKVDLICAPCLRRDESG